MATWRSDMKGSSDNRGNYQKMTETLMEEENNRMVGSLSSKISTLKNIAVDIEAEAKYQNKYVSGMDDDFSSAAGLLGSSVNRLSNMVAAGKSNRKAMCYLILILVGLFLVAYYGLGKYMKV